MLHSIIGFGAYRAYQAIATLIMKRKESSQAAESKTGDAPIANSLENAETIAPTEFSQDLRLQDIPEDITINDLFSDRDKNLNWYRLWKSLYEDDAEHLKSDKPTIDNLNNCFWYMLKIVDETIYKTFPKYLDNSLGKKMYSAWYQVNLIKTHKDKISISEDNFKQLKEITLQITTIFEEIINSHVNVLPTHAITLANALDEAIPKLRENELAKLALEENNRLA